MLLLAPSVVGVPLALVVRHMASRHLDRMGAGRLDPRGRAETYASYARAKIALALGMGAPLLCLILWWVCALALPEFW
jgi:hypothetical protein